MNLPDRDRERATEVCIDMPGVEFDDEGRSWHELVGYIAAALAEEREKARAPFLAMADEYERHAGLMRAQTDSGAPPDVVMRSQAFEDAATTIRRAAEERD